MDSLRDEAARIARCAHNLRGSPRGEDQPSPDEVSLRLSHYTSLEAIVSMLQASDGGLRLSDSNTMNDPDEGIATRDGRVISRLLNDEFGRDSWVWKRYSVAHICCLVGVDKQEQPDLEVGDDLLFWRLYGDECRGVSITMPEHVSHKLVKSSVVQRVIYTKERSMQVDVAAVSQLLDDLDKLRSRACEANPWSEICQIVIPACDLLLAQRFLVKRSHYEMEREYRAVAFVTQGDDNAPEDQRFVPRGRHVHFGRIRTYVQIPDLNCEAILTTGSQITVGRNIPYPEDVKDTVESLVEARGSAPSVVPTRVSGISYRSRRYNSVEPL